MITSVGTQWDGSIVDVISEQLDQAKDAKTVKAVVLELIHQVERWVHHKKSMMQL